MPINTFTGNMPASGQSLGFTRPLVNANFGNYRENMEVNHHDVNSANFGKHDLIQIPTVQAASPGTAAGEIALYTKTVSGAPQLFFQLQNIAPGGTDIQLTNSTVNLVATPGAVPLMGGMIMQWGNGSFANNDTVTFFTTFTSVVSIQVTINDNVTSPNAFVRSNTQSDFVFGTSAGAAVKIYWLAIGFK